MTDLGTLGDPCSRALAINQSGQTVGATAPCGGEFTHAFLWENGGPIIDLNALVVNGSGRAVREGDYINDRGEIAGRAVLPNGDVHAVILVPCDDDHADVQGCDYEPVEQGTATAVPSTKLLQSSANPVKLSTAGQLSQTRSTTSRRHSRFGPSR